MQSEGFFSPSHTNYDENNADITFIVVKQNETDPVDSYWDDNDDFEDAQWSPADEKTFPKEYVAQAIQRQEKEKEKNANRTANDAARDANVRRYGVSKRQYLRDRAHIKTTASPSSPPSEGSSHDGNRGIGSRYGRRWDTDEDDARYAPYRVRSRHSDGRRSDRASRSAGTSGSHWFRLSCLVRFDWIQRQTSSLTTDYLRPRRCLFLWFILDVPCPSYICSFARDVPYLPSHYRDVVLIQYIRVIEYVPMDFFGDLSVFDCEVKWMKCFRGLSASKLPGSSKNTHKGYQTCVDHWSGTEAEGRPITVGTPSIHWLTFSGS